MVWVQITGTQLCNVIVTSNSDNEDATKSPILDMVTGI